MKNIISCFLLLLPVLSFSQTVKDEMAKGAALKEKKQYKEAVEAFKKALVLEKENQEVLFQIAQLYTDKIKDWQAGTEYADKLIAAASDSDFLAKGYTYKGLNLYRADKISEAIPFYKKAISFAPKYDFAHYCLGEAYSMLQENEKAEKALQDCIMLNPLYGESHVLLGISQNKSTTKSLLCFFLYLTIYPDRGYAGDVYGYIVEDMASPLVPPVNPAPGEAEFAEAESLLLKLSGERNNAANKGKTDFDMLSENTKKFLKLLGELRAKNNYRGFWWDVYVPLLYGIAQNDEMYEAWIHIIAQNKGIEQVELWRKANPEKINRYKEWVRAFRPKK